MSQLFETSAEEYIENGCLARIHNLYNDDERALIRRIGEKFERVRLGFAYFSLFQANLRPLEAERISHYQLRTGWQRIGIDLADNQNVTDHQRTCELLARLLYGQDPDCALIAAVARWHDIGESVIGDFTPYCPITREDKHAIELLGIRLLTSKRDAFLADDILLAHTIFDGDDDRHAHIRRKAKEVDLLEMVLEAVSIEQNCAREDRLRISESTQPFWDYVAGRLVTNEGKEFFRICAELREKNQSLLEYFLNDEDRFSNPDYFAREMTLRPQAAEPG